MVPRKIVLQPGGLREQQSASQDHPKVEQLDNGLLLVIEDPDPGPKIRNPSFGRINPISNRAEIRIGTNTQIIKPSCRCFQFSLLPLPVLS